MKHTILTTAGLTALALFANPSLAQNPDPQGPPGASPKLSPKQLIRKLDQDGDGLISFEEFTLPDKSPASDRLADADADGDGNISRSEMEAQLRQHIEADTAKAHERFETADVNGDGFVTPEEMRQVAFERIDTNEDGYLSAEELAAAHKRRLKPGNG